MINTISFLGNVNRIQPKNIGMVQPSFKGQGVQVDTFVRSEKPKEENEFVSWAKRNNFVQSMPNVFKKENVLGKGFTHTVFSLDDNKGYVLRARTDSLNRPIDFSNYSIIDVQDKSLEANYGQAVAKIVSSDISKPTFEVMRKQEGFACGNPPSTAIYEEETGKLKAGELSYEAIERKEHYGRTMRVLAQMPQETYDELVKNLASLDDMGYKFDYYNSNNFLIDEKNKKINIIDLEPLKGHGKNLGNALYALTNIDYFGTYQSTTDGNLVSSEERNQNFDDVINIITKYNQAMVNNGEKYTEEEYEFIVKLLGSTPMMFALRARSDEERKEKLREMGIL